MVRKDAQPRPSRVGWLLLAWTIAVIVPWVLLARAWGEDCSTDCGRNDWICFPDPICLTATVVFFALALPAGVVWVIGTMVILYRKGLLGRREPSE